ncbi:MAG: hypothetical protein QE285_08795 [Aquabacterium sp.]|nr:hypothetical protein [Aquabacterium sp.]
MQLNKIAIAVVVLAAGSAFAAPNTNRIALSAGASAIQGNLNLAARNLCTTAGGVPTSFISGNFTTVVCANTAVAADSDPSATPKYSTKPNAQFVNFAGLPYAEFRYNVSDGSFGNILILNGKSYTFRDPATLSNTAAAPVGAVIVGGVNDVEPNAFPDGTIGSNVLPAQSTGVGVAQVFGVGASISLYTKMFDAQKAAGAIPASCGVNDTGLSYCIPSVGKAQMATIMAANEFNAAYSRGVGFLSSAANDGQELRYARRVDTSGTQAAAQNYFLGLPCSKAPLSIVAQPLADSPDPAVSEQGGVPDVLIGAIRVYATPGTGDVRTELNKVKGGVAGGHDVIGVLSGENNQTGQFWRWLRVNGVAIGENAVPGTAGNTNSNTMKNGTYDFFFEATSAGGTPAGDAFWTAMNSALNTLAAPVGLVNATDLAAGYTKGGLTCSGSVSN